MPFDVKPVVPAITGFTATAGVESAVLSWDPVPGFSVQVFRDAVLVATVLEDGFVDGSLPADVEVDYTVRAVRPVSGGDLVAGTEAGASVTPSRAELGTGQVQTVNVAANAITTRSAYQSSAVEYCRAGTDENDDPVDPAEFEWELAPASFTGTGTDQVINVSVRVQGIFPILRFPGQLNAFIECAVNSYDNLGALDDVLDSYATNVFTLTFQPQPATGTTPIPLSFSRDYQASFIVAPALGVPHKVTTRIWVTTEDPDNFVQLTVDQVTVIWNDFKR